MQQVTDSVVAVGKIIAQCVREGEGELGSCVRASMTEWYDE